MTNPAQARTLAAALWPAEAAASAVRFVVLALLGSLVLWLSAKIQVPFYPVPMTLQTLAIMGLAAAYGSRLAAATVALYLAQGAAGLPVFVGTPEKGIGIAYMMGSTGGYLLGFLIAAGIVGWFAERGYARNPFKLFGVMIAADVVIFALGLIWLGILFGWDKPILEWGLYPFIAGDVTKIALAALAVPAVWTLVDRWRARQRRGG